MEKPSDVDVAKFKAAHKAVRETFRQMQRLAKNADTPVRFDRGRDVALNLMFAQFATIIRGLAERIVALEARPQTEYRGVWSRQTDYSAGNMVTDHGALWTARINTKGVRPGDGNCWRLSVKKGQAG